MLLVDTDVDQVHLEVGELKYESFQEDRDVIILLLLVIFHLRCVYGDFAELTVHVGGQDSLHDRHYQIKVAIGVTVTTRIGEVGKARDVESTTMMLGSYGSSDVKKAYDDKTTEAPTRQANEQGF